ncbi:dynein intermediate chain 3, ciliary-like isoform X1 [Pseudomyrmex gracilis]|uniref:dynein intermediate chain 3, ciliary-like isoform X1 n=2 Tax=Pseudomyrmex gracilis TaxID=219809 RepID=UPI000995863F|nr:dynein intermediate chain 3, ciliary-like isoform X1 [Pseudomyrmex gracilis]
MEIKQVFLKTRAEFGKQCIFDVHGPHLDLEIKSDPDAMANYVTKTYCNVNVQFTKQLALHEAQTVGVHSKNSGMFHFEGGWPKEINPKDEETTARFRRRVEKDDEWASKLRNLFKQTEHNLLQNGALNIYENYFDDMIPSELVKPRSTRIVNVYEDPQKPTRSVNNISWSPDTGSKMAISYCSFGIEPDYSKIAYIWQIDDPNKPWMTLEAPSATVVNEFNPRDPSVLVSGLTSGQVCSWDIRTGTTPVQTSHRQFSHRDFTTTVKWIATKSNTEFFSGSTDGRAMWWDTRKLRSPTEILVFDLLTPNTPVMDRAIGVTSADYEPSVGTKFMFGLENGIVISGSRKAKTPAEKLALRFDAHYGPVLSVDRSGFHPKIFLTVGDCTARIWTEETKDDSLVTTRFIREDPVRGCWNKVRHSLFYVITRVGILTIWDLLMGLRYPMLSVKLCKQKLTAIAAHETGALLAVGNSVGMVYLVESTEALYSFDKNERNDLMTYLETGSRFVKTVDTRLKEIKLQKSEIEASESILVDAKDKKKNKHIVIEHEQKRKMHEKREKSRVASKRRVKNDDAELHDAEERFFEIVNQEKQKYTEEINDLNSFKEHRSMKKLSSRKIEKDWHAMINEERETAETKVLAKKIFNTKKPEIVIPTTEIAQDVEQEKEMTEEFLPPLVETVLEYPAKEISKRKRRKVRKRVPKKWLRRSAARAVEGREEQDKVDEKTRSRNDVRTKMSIGRKDEMRRKKRVSWTKLLRAHKREERVHSLQKTMLLEKLVEDATRAKREIREANKARMKTRKFVQKDRKCSTVTAEKSRHTPELKKEDLAKEVTSTTKKLLATKKRRKVHHMAAVIDLCAPVWKPSLLTKDVEALIGGPLLEKSIKEREKPSIAYLEKIETAHTRVHPQIFNFHRVE